VPTRFVQSYSKEVQFLPTCCDQRVTYLVIGIGDLEVESTFLEQFCMSRSPAVIADLRLLYRYLWECAIKIEVEQLPSALNLCADRLRVTECEYWLDVQILSLCALHSATGFGSTSWYAWSSACSRIAA
jgi:hypothetical protein